jgi:hypothetical protein
VNPDLVSAIIFLGFIFLLVMILLTFMFWVGGLFDREPDVPHCHQCGGPLAPVGGVTPLAADLTMPPGSTQVCRDHVVPIYYAAIDSKPVVEPFAGLAEDV